MAFEKVHLLGKVELDIVASAGGTLTIQTDIPGEAMADRGTVTIPTCTRRVVRSRLPYNFHGHLFQFKVTATGTVRLYGVRVWARELPGGQWQWYPLPVPETSEAWSAFKLLVPPTAEDWSDVRVPIPGTAEEFSAVHLPIKPTPDVPSWAALELDRP